MVVNKGSVVIDQKIGSANTQIMSEGEITLPEDKADIAKLLSCSCSFVIDESRVNDGRVSFSGRLKIMIMYLCKANAVHSISHEIPVSDFVNIDGAAEGMSTYINCSIANCTSKTVNERKVIYKVLTDVEAVLHNQLNCDYVEGLGEIPINQQRFEKMTVESLPVQKQDRFTVKDSLSLPMGKPNIDELLCCQLKLSSVDYKAGEGSVRVSGDVNASIIYKGEGETNPMELYEGSIPFKGELDAEGIKSDMLCDVRLTLLDSLNSVQADEDGEKRIIDVEAVIGTNTTARATNEVNALKDVYILNKTTKLSINDVRGNVCVARNTSQCPVKEVITLDENAPDMLQIYNTDGSVYVDYVQINDGKIEIEGAVAANILYVTGNDAVPVYCCQGVVPFKHIAQASGANADMDCSVIAGLEHIGFNMLSDREVELRCVVNICMSVEDTKDYSFVEDITLEDVDKEYLNSLASITLYVVHKGDTLWKLAKRFNTTVEDIAKINDIENPDLIYPGQRLIIVKRIA